MKFPRFTPFPGRYAFLRHLLPALVAGGICLSSCEDDMDRPSLSSHVSFTSEISSTWRTPLPVPLPMPVLRRVLSPPYKAAALPFTCTRFTPTASLPPLRAADRTRPSLPVPFPSRMTICTTVLVSPLTPTPVRGAKAAPPTTSIMPLPANPPAAIMHLPPPITGPVLHIK